MWFNIDLIFNIFVNLYLLDILECDATIMYAQVHEEFISVLLIK